MGRSPVGCVGAGDVVNASRERVGLVQPSCYRIVVEGELGPRYAGAFAGMRFETVDGNTEIVGVVEDQAELLGLIQTVTALGLSLVSVTPIGE
jgi:hypothetical protein